MWKKKLIILLVFLSVFSLELFANQEDRFAEDLERLARWCEENALESEAAETRQLILPKSEHQYYLPVFPLKAGLLDEHTSLARKSDGKQGEWRKRLIALRDAHATAMFEQVVRLAKEKKGGEAIECLLSVLRANPDHFEARTILGFTLKEGAWRTSWEVEQLKKGMTDHPQFGWIAIEHASRHEAGERFYIDASRRKEEWITAEEERRRRHEIRNGWDISSEHYDLRTNVGLEEGVAMVRRLEDLYRAWKLLFCRFWSTEELLARMILNVVEPPSTSTSPTKKAVPKKQIRHSVYVYRDKADYVRNLTAAEPNIGKTTGYYLPNRRRCYFYPADTTKMDEIDRRHVEATLLHEATHQLFQESLGIVGMPGEKGNYWIIEGAAMYMETLRRENMFYVVGDPGCDRLRAARIRFTGLRKGAFSETPFYLPLDMLVSLGKDDYQWFRGYPVPGKVSEELPKLYSQSAAMAHFLMHAESGAFRAAMIEYLRLVYLRNDRQNTLARLTGKSYRQLDRLYETFILHEAGLPPAGKTITESGVLPGHREADKD